MLLYKVQLKFDLIIMEESQSGVENRTYFANKPEFSFEKQREITLHHLFRLFLGNRIGALRALKFVSIDASCRKLEFSSREESLCLSIKQLFDEFNTNNWKILSNLRKFQQKLFDNFIN